MQRLIHSWLSSIYLLGLVCILSCEEKSFPYEIEKPKVASYSIVSAEVKETNIPIEIKVPIGSAEDFTLRMTDQSEKEVQLIRGSNENLGNFKLIHYTATVQPGATSYVLNLKYPMTGNLEGVCTRRFTAKETISWTKLPHAPIVGGDFTGAALISPLFGNQIGVYRYANEEKWDILKFNTSWTSTEGNYPLPRHNAMAFPLGQLGGQELVFVGFGYQSNEKLPGKKAYLDDLWWSSSFYTMGQSAGIVFPVFSGMDTDLKHFLIESKAYILKENSSGEMRSIDITWDQKDCSPLPEMTGQLATFAIDGIGYVVNQRSDQRPHLYAYNPIMNKWERKADFPGQPREYGIAFSAKNNGYFGMGVNVEEKGLKDIWKYEVISDTWIYHSEFPGQGNRSLIACSAIEKAFIGWGYEKREVSGAGSEWVGCTDFWTFNP